MNITPRATEGPDDQLVLCEKPEEKLSAGAEKLFQKFITHAFAKWRKATASPEHFRYMTLCKLNMENT